MSETLKALLQDAKTASMSASERQEQAMSFAYGNGAIDDTSITRDSVAAASARLAEQQDS